jgi:hypothetical protein
MLRRTICSVFSKRSVIVLTSVALTGAGMYQLPSRAVAANPFASGSVDPNVVAGSQSAPDMGYLSAVAAGCIRHITTAGNDSSDGSTVSQAWRTLAKAMNALTPGQTACVHAGTYHEAQLLAPRAGTAAAPIAIKGAPGEPGPTIIATSDQSLLDFQPGIGYWLIEGLDVSKNETKGATVRVLGGHHIAVRNNVLRDGKSGAAVLLTQGATDVLVEGNDIHNHHRWENPANPSDVEHSPKPGLRRSDANAVNVEGSGVARVMIKHNHLHHNGGDGFQCIGHHDDQGPSSGDGADIDLVDNRINSNVEDAVDVKSCQRVSVRGSVSPDSVGSAADNKFYNLRPTNKDTDLPGNHAGGGAIVIHYYARHVLVENTRIWDTCDGIAIGREDFPPVDSVIIRRSLFFNLVGTNESVGTNSCTGQGIRITSAKHVDIHDNTFDGVPATAVMLATDNGNNASVSDDIDVWNNIISRAEIWLALRRHGSSVPGGATRVDSDRNVFWHPDGSTNHFILEADRVDLSAWRSGTGQDQTSIHANPLFINDPVNNDYFVQAQPRSPALDTALNNTGAPFCGAGPDIGFRERCP